MPTEQLGDLEMAGQRKKQTSFDITNYAPAQKGLQQSSPSIGELSPPAQQVPGNIDRARRMQAQFDQPVSKGIPPGGIASGLAGADGVGAARQTSFDITNTPAAQRQAGIQPGLPAAAGATPGAVPSSSRPMSISDGLDLEPSTQQQSGDWYRTGAGAGRSGGEIVGRRGSNGVMEFTHQAATPGLVSSARAMPSGGMGSIGDGIGGGLSVGAPGDAQLAFDRYERANQERRQMIATSQRGELGNNGGKLTIVQDSSRSPTLADRQRARFDERQANTELTRQRTQQSILAGLDERMTGQLERQRLQQEMQAGDLAIDREQALSGILAGLSDPNLQGDARAQSEREYLMRADPKAFLERQARSGIDQVDLEKKQLERDLLRLELDQGGIGGGLKLTEQQSKDLGYYTRGNEANAQLARQGDALTSRATGERGQVRGLADTLVRGTPWIGDSALANSLVSTERQQAEQAGREVLAAILRKDTGAAITQQEMEIYGRMYLPQPGDSDEVLNQKAEARTRALASIRGGLGTAERKAAPLLDGQRTSNAAPTRISGDDDYGALPSGALFVAPDGTTRRKP